MKKRTFTKEEKLKILKEVESEGLNVTLSKYGIYPASYYFWKEKFDQMGDSGFDHGMKKEHIKRIRQLEKENALLKKIVAEKELEGQLQQELLKKKFLLEKKKK